MRQRATGKRFGCEVDTLCFEQRVAMQPGGVDQIDIEPARAIRAVDLHAAPRPGRGAHQRFGYLARDLRIVGIDQLRLLQLGKDARAGIRCALRADSAAQRQAGHSHQGHNAAGGSVHHGTSWA
ncbi:MAG: hypothetical protein ACREWG_12980 [Gammaproteobacteria bacterium]